jgi:AsmA protein
MPRALKMTLIVLAPLVLLVAVAVFLLSRVDTKSEFETVASDATGLDVAVKGKVSIGLFPIPHATLKDVTLKNKGSQIVSANEADVGVEFWPLLRKEVHIKRLVLQNVNIDIARDRRGHYNFTPSKTEQPLSAMSLGRVSLVNATLHYTNQETDRELKATDCKFDSNDFQLSEGASEDILKHVSLSASVVCAEMHNNLFVGTDVHFSIVGENGVFKLQPVTMRIMDGKGSGNIDANFTGTSPVYRVHYAVTQLHVGSLFKSIAPGKVGEGFMDFTTDLGLRGWNADEMTRSADGEASLRGKDLDFAIGDLDKTLSRYESSQNFNLVDVGAFFIAGPFGLVVTKGYNFASIFQGTGGNTHIRSLVSHWQVADGVAHAQDVAMATKENRLAMKGALDFVDMKFDDVTVAILDNRGCARVEQRIRGAFSKPVVERPNVISSLTGPVSRLVGKTRRLFGAKCRVLYEGSVTP